MLGSSGWRTFVTVTLPTARYGLLSAAIAVFTLTICDFGVAKVIGGQYSVLATDIYRQVIGMQNFSLGAVASVTLLLPALLSFALEHRVRSKMQEQSSTKAVPYQPKTPSAAGSAGARLVHAVGPAVSGAGGDGRLRLPGAVLALQPRSDAGSLRL